MPYFAHSTASDIVIECTAAFAIADGTTYADPVHTQVVSMDRTLPGSPSRIHRLPAASVVWNDPFMTVPVMASKARGLSPWVWAMKFAAAPFTTPVSGPCSDQIDSIVSSTWSNRRTSTVCTCTLPGRAADTSSAASFRTPARRPHRCTTAPWSTRCRATPRPRPEPPPVIRMRLPSSSRREKACTSVPVVGGEVGTALLVERGDPFPGLAGLAQHLQAGVGHLADAGEVLGVGVERLLEHLECGGGELQDLVSPGPDFLVKLVRRHHLVGQAPLEGLLSGVLAAEEPDLASPLLTDGPGHQAGAETSVERADPRAVLTERLAVGGDGQVTQQVQNVPPADGEPVDRRDGRLRYVADHTVKRVHLEQPALRGPVVARLHPLLLVPAGAERLVARAGEGNDADLVADPGPLERQHELVDGARAEGVVALRPVDHDPGEAVLDLIRHVGEVVHRPFVLPHWLTPARPPLTREIARSADSA